MPVFRLPPGIPGQDEQDGFQVDFHKAAGAAFVPFFLYGLSIHSERHGVPVLVLVVYTQIGASSNEFVQRIMTEGVRHMRYEVFLRYIFPSIHPNSPGVIG